MIDTAKVLFIEHGYPATTLDSVADAADVPLPTLYRLFGSKRALLRAVLDTSFVGDDEPIAFVDRTAVQAALSEPDPHRADRRVRPHRPGYGPLLCHPPRPGECRSSR